MELAAIESFSQYLTTVAGELALLATNPATPTDIDSIHDARVATRRLGAALSILKPVISKKPRRRVARVLRKLRRALGELRDTDVMLERLAKLAKKSAPGEAIAWAQSALQHQREAQVQNVAAALVAYGPKLSRWEKVQAQIDSAHEAVHFLIAQAVHSQFETYSECADHLTLDNSHFQLDEQSLPQVHQLRIAGKKVRYSLEMARTEKVPGAQEAVEIFKDLQESLGLWHDSVMLAENLIALSLEHQLCLRDAALEAQLLALTKDELAVAEKHLAQFKEQWRQHAQKLGELLRDGFALSRHVEMPWVIESQTDRDPPGSPESPGPGASARPDAPGA